jgi:hypothetical protein
MRAPEASIQATAFLTSARMVASVAVSSEVRVPSDRVHVSVHLASRVHAFGETKCDEILPLVGLTLRLLNLVIILFANPRAALDSDGEVNMKTLELAVVLAAAAVLAIWRGIAMYRQTFRRKNL